MNCIWELEVLIDRLQWNMALAIPPATSTQLGPILVADTGTVERACTAVQAAHHDKPIVSLPPIIPGFKANPLDLHKSLLY